ENENSGGPDYLPTVPDRANEYEEWTLWADVPAAAFDDPASWLHRSQLKQIYSIAERSYFRWINTLKQNGLKRMRPARKDWKVKLFYRADVEKAIASLQAATEARPRRGRKPSSTLASNTLSGSP